MRTATLLLLLSLAACTVQPAGARCEQDQDCNAAASEVCRNEAEPNAACQGAASCICCPSDRNAAAAVPGCVVARFTPDAGADR